jgi:hypothetical protein
MHKTLVRNSVLGLLILAIGAVHVLTLRAGHVWGDDFAQYLHHARNLAQGLPYAETGYLYNPGYASLGPRTYPPITPVLLVPVYWVCGFDLAAMKGVMIACFLVFLAAVAVAFRDDLPGGQLALLVAMLGLNRFFLEETNSIGSDMPFLALLYGAIVFIHQGEKAADRPRRRLAWYLAAGVLAYLAYGTRSVGALLVPAVVLADLLRFRRITRPVMAACLVFGGLAALQALLLHSDRSYLDQLGAPPAVLLGNAVSYVAQWAAFFRNGYSKPAAGVLFAAVSLLAVLGYGGSLRRPIAAREIFPAIYLAVVLLWPSYQGIRFLFPIFPLYLFYALRGLEHPWLAGRPRLRRVVAVVLLAAVGLSYVASATRIEIGPLREGVAKPESVALFDYVRAHTEAGDAIIFVKPRAMSLLTGRASSVYHGAQDDRGLWDYFEKIGARYLVVVENDDALKDAESPELLEYLRQFVARNGPRLERTWGNADFTVYRVR